MHCSTCCHQFIVFVFIITFHRSNINHVNFTLINKWREYADSELGRLTFCYADVNRCSPNVKGRSDLYIKRRVWTPKTRHHRRTRQLCSRTCQQWVGRVSIFIFFYYFVQLLPILHSFSEKNAPNLASCSFDKHGLILIILVNGITWLSKIICIFNFPYPSTLTYFICFWIAVTEMAWNNVFLGRLLVALKRAGCVVC